MPYKICPSCQQTSYSACVSSIWLCPYCGKELTFAKAVYNRRRLPMGAESKARHSQCGLYVLK